MATLTINQQSQLLEAAAETLDIPIRLYEDAVLKYSDVGLWLSQEGSELADYHPDIYPQGSFRLGTMVRPISDNDEYDIDLVCLLTIDKDDTTKAELKKMVGDRLRKRSDLAEMMQPSRRAWTLNYPAQFHMDVLPTIPNLERKPTGILLTDKALHEWQKSNPIAYADWFYKRMEVIYLEKRAAIAKEIQASIEEVPYWQVKTPLQRVVQILKRHRDVYFQNDLEDRPVSIIITTLAATAYRNQADLSDALLQVVKEMPNFIQKRGDKWWVANPVEPDENFADKWNEYPSRKEAFFEWLDRAYNDFTTAARRSDIRKSAEDLSPVLGEGTMVKAATSLRGSATSVIASSASSTDQVPALADARHCLPPVWPVKAAYKASLTGTVHRDMFHPKKMWDMTTRSVPKNVALRFQLKTNVPWPYEVRWQIVNTGREALAKNQLRGDFESSNEPGRADVRWESTAYAGTHWIEGFVIKNGVCVARTGQKFVRIRG